MYTDEAVAESGPASGVSGESLVAVTDLTKRYGRRLAVHCLSLRLRAREVVGLVGSNGSGKTTTLRMLAGILKPNGGHGKVLGFDLFSEAAQIREHAGYMSQSLSLYGDLSVFQNLRFRAQVYGLSSPRAAADAAIADFELAAFASLPAGRLSGGWARRLQLAAALIHSPRLVFLDEPTAGLDAVARLDVWRRIGILAAEGAGVIVSTHDFAEAERCSYAVLLSEGKIVAAGTPVEIAGRASAGAFLIYGPDARQLAQPVESTQGVIASYPQGPSLRVVADPNAEESLRRVASIHGANVTRVATRLEDAMLAFSRRRSAE